MLVMIVVAGERAKAQRLEPSGDELGGGVQPARADASAFQLVGCEVREIASQAIELALRDGARGCKQKRRRQHRRRRCYARPGGSAVIVGETTFGKGSVQSVIQLQDGSALRLTTAKYYTPSKQVIHEHGVTPTIRATFSIEQERQLMALRNEESLTDAQRKELQNFRDTQLERAVAEVMKALETRPHKVPPRPPDPVKTKTPLP